MGISRRDFLVRVGQAGGYGAAFATMQSLGLMPMQGEGALPIQAAAGSGKGVKVVVLGGGIGGLVSAYELKKLGYEVTVLEARERPGGRNWTGRGGTKVKFTDGTVQTIAWEEGNYQNMGPARLPSTHWTMLGYCRELGVPLEVEVNTSRSTFFQSDAANGGKPVVQRKAVNDTRGHVSELLSKCVANGALDSELTKEDKERMLAFLKIYGPLNEKSAYVGSERAGYKTAPGAGRQVGVDEEPLDMRILLDEDFWFDMFVEEAWDWQATMMQPVGGMDRIPYAFAKALGPIVQYSSPVTEIRKTANGVRVSYTQGGAMKQGAAKQMEAAYCIIALPFSILKKIPNDLSAPFKKVVDESTMGGAYKLAWESRRFWEQDYNIYGGLSYLRQGPSPVWYPSSRLMHPTGVVVSGYTDELNTAFYKMTLQEKYEASRASIEKIHPGHGKELKNPVFVGWSRVPWNEGSWIRSYGGDGYNVIIEADGPIYFAGDTASHIVGWQEGAALSARRAVGMICEKVKAAKLSGVATGVVQGLFFNEETVMKIMNGVMAAALMAVACAMQAQVAVKHLQDDKSPIATGVWAGDTFYLSGQLASPVTPADAAKGTAAVYGDTKTQAFSALTKIQGLLKAQGLDMKDVVKMTVFLAGDPANGGKLDFPGLQASYTQFFGTKDQPNKPARSAVQVAALAAPWALIEIEVIAVKGK